MDGMTAELTCGRSRYPFVAEHGRKGSPDHDQALAQGRAIFPAAVEDAMRSTNPTVEDNGSQLAWRALRRAADRAPRATSLDRPQPGHAPIAHALSDGERP